MQLGLRVKISSQLKLIRPPNSVSEGSSNCCSSALHVKAGGLCRGEVTGVLADAASSAKLTPTRRLTHSWNLQTELPVSFPFRTHNALLIPSIFSEAIPRRRLLFTHPVSYLLVCLSEPRLFVSRANKWFHFPS